MGSRIVRRLAPVLPALALGLFCPCGDAMRAMAAPEPSPVPLRWELDVETGQLRLAMVEVAGEGLRPFLYLPYKVENNSGQEVYFAPTFELSTDESAEVQRAGRGVPASVTDEIIRRLSNPFVQDQISVIGPLLQGAEHARESVAVWPVENMKPSRVTVYASGFSGETKRVTPPDASKEGGEAKEVVLRKTLMLEHLTPGDLAGQGNDPISRTNTRWILR
ncbi:MAG: hypothetical protein AB7G17_02910 [Phycisphaerales bacterium]